MRCKKLRKIYPKYTDGELSEQERQSVEEHIRDCPDCTANVSSLGKMRSLLRTAAKIEVSDEYWDTYWDRLEKKLPDEPAQVTAVSRISGAFAELFRRPVVLGRAMVVVILLAFLVYTASDRQTKKLTMPASVPPSTERMEEMEMELFSAVEEGYRQNEEAAGIASKPRQPSPPARVGDAVARPEDQTIDAPAKLAAGETDLAVRRKPSEDKELTEALEHRFSYAQPEEPVSAPTLSAKTAKVQEGLGEVDYLLGDVQDEYTVAENYFQSGDYVQAIPAYQNFITANTVAKVLDDRTLRAQYQIGEAHFQMQNYSDALSNFVVVANADKAERADTDREKSYDLYYGSKAELKKDEKAKELAQSKSQLGRGLRTRARLEPQVQAHGSVVDADELRTSDDQMRDHSAGLTAIRKVLAPIETREQLISRAIFRQAQSYENLKKNKEALATYRVYIEKYPQGEYISQAREKITPKAAADKKAEKAGKAGSEEKENKPESKATKDP